MWGSFVDSKEEAHAQLDALVNAGVNFIDTAELYPVAFNYGRTTEEWIGEWLQARVAAGTLDRSNFYISTKCNMAGAGGTPAPGGEGGPHAYEREVLEASCRASIARLQCDYIDLYQLHWPTRDTPIFGCGTFFPEGEHRPMPFADRGESAAFDEQVLAIKALFDAGLIRHWGLSNENNFGLTMFCTACDRLGVPRPVSCQNEYSLVNRTYESNGWEAAHRFSIAGLPYAVLCGGVLTGKYLPGSRHAARTLEGSRHCRQPDFQPRYGSPMVMLAAERYAALADAYGITPTELALAWAVRRACNTSVIIGTTSAQQVRECVAAFLIELPQPLLEAIDDVHEEIRNPAIYLGRQHTWMVASWLGADARKASEAATRKAIEAASEYTSAAEATAGEAAGEAMPAPKRQKA